MIQKILIKQIEYNSKEYRESVELRNQVLRRPLGMTLDERCLQNERDDIHIAYFEDGVIVGTLILSPKGDGVVKMRQVAVEREHQGMGIGAALVKYAEEIAVANKFSVMILNARSSALDFYKKMGYKTKGEEYRDDLLNLLHYDMEKNLV